MKESAIARLDYPVRYGPYLLRPMEHRPVLAFVIQNEEHHYFLQGCNIGENITMQTLIDLEGYVTSPPLLTEVDKLIVTTSAYQVCVVSAGIRGNIKLDQKIPLAGKPLASLLRPDGNIIMLYTSRERDLKSCEISVQDVCHVIPNSDSVIVPIRAGRIPNLSVVSVAPDIALIGWGQPRLWSVFSAADLHRTALHGIKGTALPVACDANMPIVALETDAGLALFQKSSRGWNQDMHNFRCVSRLGMFRATNESVFYACIKDDVRNEYTLFCTYQNTNRHTTVEGPVKKMIHMGTRDHILTLTYSSRTAQGQLVEIDFATGDYNVLGHLSGEATHNVVVTQGNAYVACGTNIYRFAPSTEKGDEKPPTGETVNHLDVDVTVKAYSKMVEWNSTQALRVELTGKNANVKFSIQDINALPIKKYGMPPFQVQSVDHSIGDANSHWANMQIKMLDHGTVLVPITVAVRYERDCVRIKKVDPPTEFDVKPPPEGSTKIIQKAKGDMVVVNRGRLTD